MGTQKIGMDRVWLNPRDVGCMAAVNWSVDVYYSDKDNKAEVNAQIQINDEGQCHWIARRADLKPVRTMTRVLNQFQDAVDEAFDWIKQEGYELDKIPFDIEEL
jgi:hypothetical protein